MMHGADAAEQMVRLSLEGMEVVLRVSGTGAKNLAVLLAAAIKEEKQTLGKTSLTSLIKSGRELTVFSIPEEDLAAFKREAKRYGVLYSDIKDRGDSDNPVIDIITRAEDAPKINRIIERFDLATVKEKSRPNQSRTREDLRSETGYRQRDTTRIKDGEDKVNRTSVKAKLKSMRQQRTQKGKVSYDRER
ncbi:MAG: PcfB family protein [Firmicutes bacterium]|nr:PcfB family protein [Bacillota bacterium]